MARMQDLQVYANVPYVATVATGVTGSGWRGTLQWRRYAGAPAVLLDLPSVVDAREGVRVSADGTTATIRIEAATLEALWASVSSDAVAGGPIALAYDLVLSPLFGDDRVLIDGAVVLKAGVTRASVSAPRLGGTGDSMIDHSHFADPAGAYFVQQALGEMCWAQALYPFFVFPTWLDNTHPTNKNGLETGVTGDKISDVLARMPDVLARRPDFQFVAIGANSVIANEVVATNTADLQTISDLCLAAGVPLLLANIRPIGATVIPDADGRLAKLTAINNWIAAHAAAADHVELVDFFSVYDDGTGRPKAGYTSDDLHITRTAAYIGGFVLAAAIAKVVGRGASARPSGTNLISNPTFTGTAGTLGTGCTGTMATDWRVDRGSGSPTAAAAQVAGFQTVTIDPNSAGAEAINVGRSFGGITVTPGTWIQGSFEFTLSAWTGWREAIAYFDNLIALDGHDAAAVMPVISETSFTIITPPFLVPPGTTSVAPVLRFWVDGAASGAGIVKLVRGSLSVVPDPRLVADPVVV